MQIDFGKIISKDFPYRIKKRGKELFENDDVKLVNLDNKNRIITGTVQGSQLYYQLITVNNTGSKIVSSQCSCPYNEYCKHQAAILYWANANLNEDGNTTKQSQRPKKANKKGGLHKAMCRSEFIDIPSTNIDEIMNSYCKRNRPYGLQYVKYETVFIESTHLKVSIINTGSYSWSNTKELSAEVEIKIRNKNSIQIKCSECDSKSKYLCEHDYIVLRHLMYIRSNGFLKDAPKIYEDVCQRCAEDVSMSLAAFKQHFNVTVSSDGLKIFSNNPNILLSPERLNSYGKIKYTDKNFIVEKTKTKLKKLDFIAAFEWQGYDFEDLIIPIIGKPRKRDGVLTSRISELDRIDRLKTPLLQIYNQIIEVEQEHEYSESRDQCFEKLHGIMRDNLEVLTQDYHYYYNEDYGGRIYDVGKKIKNYKPFKFSSIPVTFNAKVSEKDSLYWLNIELLTGDLVIDSHNVSFYNELFLVANETAYLYGKYDLCYIIEAVLKQNSIGFLGRDKGLLLEQIAKLDEFIDVDIDQDIDISKVYLVDGKKSIYLSREDDAIFFEPRIIDGNRTISILEERYLIEEDSIIEIDKNVLDDFFELIKSLHPAFGTQLNDYGFLFLDTNQFIDNLWFYDFYEACKNNEIEIFGQENLTDLNYSTSKASISSSIKSGIDWFDVDVDMSFGSQSIVNKSWIKAIKSNQRFIKLDDGSLGIIPEEWFEKLKQIHANTEIINGDLKLSKFNYNVIDELFEDVDDERTMKDIQEKRAIIESIKSIDTSEVKELPKSVTATLRPYQHQGYNWLRFLQEYKFGGILADDMGLGKTIQTICILAYAIEQNLTKCNLVIVPRSLLFNWASELEKFAPSLQYLVHHGPNREKDSIDFIKDNQIIISTYDTVAADILLFKDVEFNYIVLDESQAIKNPASKRFKAMRLLSGVNRLTMTGTPIENNTFDLYAQLSFVNPGCFGSMQKFKEKYSTPIDVKGDEDAAKLLKQLIYPFLLRRTKEQVATDLPEKTESIIYCDMPADQRKKYDELKEVIKQDVYNTIKEKGLSQSRFKILEGLLRLRQMCNSPKILMPSSKAGSAKIKAIEDLLTGELKDKNVLIFSQFVSMLGLIKRSLKNHNINYAYLDGQTRDRQKAVAQFMDDDSCSVFLISLKAGNTGLNLTKADYVFIVDPWWNPAVEAQAIDRTHRIGQDKRVFAYRLICKDSIEEKIMALKDKKRKVANDIIQVDDKIFKSLGKKQILNLFD